MDIKFDPYHIGIKFQLFFVVSAFINKMLPRLKKSGYKVNLDISLPSSSVSPQPYRKIAEKDSVRLELNLAANSINVVSENPAKSIKVFKEIIDLVESEDYKLDKVIEFIEVIVNTHVATKSKPAELLSKKVLFDFSDISGGLELSPHSIKYSNYLDESAKDKFAEFTIQPNLANPDKLFMSMVCRRKSKDEIITFTNGIKKNIGQFIKKLEG